MDRNMSVRDTICKTCRAKLWIILIKTKNILTNFFFNWRVEYWGTRRLCKNSRVTIVASFTNLEALGFRIINQMLSAEELDQSVRLTPFQAMRYELQQMPFSSYVINKTSFDDW